MGPRTIHLVRHGEVFNPDHVVYADLPGFGLSDLGQSQAAATGRHLAARPVGAVLTSPLERALSTAAAIAAGHGLEPIIDARLTEWRLSHRWAGHVWEELDTAFPGDLQAYLEHPAALDFSPEPLSTVAARVAEAIGEALGGQPSGDVVFVSHQDPVQAARLALTGRRLETLNQDKPGHAEVVTLTKSPNDDLWTENERWVPDQGPAFPPVD